MDSKLTVLFIVLGIALTVHSLRGIESQLLEQATDYAAPFSKTSIAKLKSHIIGSSRSDRTTDVAIINTTGEEFNLEKHSCETGGWTGELLPEHIILPHSSVVYGAESSGVWTGATNCEVLYQSPHSSAFFSVRTSNPYVGKNTARGSGHGVHVKTFFGKGDHNIVKIIVE